MTVTRKNKVKRTAYVGIFNSYKYVQGFKDKNGQNEQADGKSHDRNREIK